MAIKPFDVTVKGAALETFGFTEGNQIDGFGLLTYGLIWGCPNIWSYYLSGVTVSNTWTLALGYSISTSWSLCAGASIITGWSLYSTQGVENC